MTTSLDGSEDGQLHCFKLPDLFDGLRLLFEARAAQIEAPALLDIEQEPEENNDSDPHDDDVLVDHMLDLDLGAELEL